MFDGVGFSLSSVVVFYYFSGFYFVVKEAGWSDLGWWQVWLLVWPPTWLYLFSIPIQKRSNNIIMTCTFFLRLFPSAFFIYDLIITIIIFVDFVVLLSDSFFIFSYFIRGMDCVCVSLQYFTIYFRRRLFKTFNSRDSIVLFDWISL